MALPFGVLDQELDLALQRGFGRPGQPRQQQVFGIGMRHITEGRMDWPGSTCPLCPKAAHLSQEAFEHNWPTRSPRSSRKSSSAPARTRSARSGSTTRTPTTANGWSASRTSSRQTIVQHGLTGELIDHAVRGTDFGDIRPVLVEALGRIGLTYDQFMQGITVGELMSFIDDLPTRYVTNVMRSAKHRQTQQRWEPNDFIDIVALPVAAVYCDVVVTEKQWAQRMRHGKVDQRYNTVLLNHVADLVDALVSATAS